MMLDYPINKLPLATFDVGYFDNKVLKNLAKIAPNMTIWELYLINKIN